MAAATEFCKTQSREGFRDYYIYHTEIVDCSCGFSVSVCNNNKGGVADILDISYNSENLPLLTAIL